MLKNDTFPVVRVHDPALRRASFAEVKRYARTRDPDDLPKLPFGETPITFHCRRLTRSQVFDFVEPALNDNRKYGRAFAAGVVRVSGGRFGDAPGWSPTDADRPDYLAMEESEIEELDFAIADLVDIGSVIYLRSVAPKDCAPRFPLQPMSLVVWEGYVHLSAEQTQDDAARSSGAHKEG